MEVWYKLRYLWASLTFRERPVVKRVRYVEDLVEEVMRHCPRPYRMMCLAAAKELNLSLSAIADAGRDVPTAVALALEDVTTGSPDMPRFWRYIKTGDPGPDATALLQKWRRVFRLR
ncbi:MAG: hypothetical protein QW434_09675 [Pyrobaculum sp.]